MRIASALLLVGVGCGSVTTYQSADTLPRGSWNGFAAIGAGVFKDTPMQTKTPTANGEIGARVGVADNTDVGLKLYTFGIEASVKQRLIAGTWSLAVIGAIGGVKIRSQELILAQARIGAIATRRTSPRFAWNVGLVTTESLYVPAGGGHATGTLLGGFGGLDRRLGERWHLVPELSIHRAIIGDVPVDGTVAELGIAVSRDF